MLPGFQGVKWFHDFKGEKLAPKLEGAGFSTSCTKMCFKKPDASSKSFSYCESNFDFTPELQIYMFPSHHVIRKNKMWMWTSHCYVSIVMSPSQDALVITWKTYIFWSNYNISPTQISLFRQLGCSELGEMQDPDQP